MEGGDDGQEGQEGDQEGGGEGDGRRGEALLLYTRMSKCSKCQNDFIPLLKSDGLLYKTCDRCKCTDKKYRDKHKEQIKLYRDQYYLNNQDKIKVFHERCAGRDDALVGRHCACPCSLHRQRRAPILGSPCSPHFSGAFSRTGGARACAPRPWRMLECGGAAVPFSRTSAAAAGGTAQLRGRETSTKIARLAHYNFAPCGVGGRWRGL
jgi:hypothetical protein